MTTICTLIETVDVIAIYHVSDSEWKLLMVRQHHLVGTLPSGAAIYKITKIAILPLCQDEPKELELEVSDRPDVIHLVEPLSPLSAQHGVVLLFFNIDLNYLLLIIIIHTLSFISIIVM